MSVPHGTVQRGFKEHQTDRRRLTAFSARWLMDGSVPARDRRAWARRSVVGIRLPVSPERTRAPRVLFKFAGGVCLPRPGTPHVSTHPYTTFDYSS